MGSCLAPLDVMDSNNNLRTCYTLILEPSGCCYKAFTLEQCYWKRNPECFGLIYIQNTNPESKRSVTVPINEKFRTTIAKTSQV